MSSSPSPEDEPARPLDALFASVYGELRTLAERRLAAERTDHTLSATALVHEVYLKLSGQSDAYQNREHFFAIAAQAMRRVLVDYARRHRALKRPQLDMQVSSAWLDASGAVFLAQGDDAGDRADFLIALDDALQVLGSIDTRLARVVELRFFAGLTERETAEILDVTPRTVTRDWARARGWLYGRLSDGASRHA